MKELSDKRAKVLGKVATGMFSGAADGNLLAGGRL